MNRISIPTGRQRAAALKRHADRRLRLYGTRRRLWIVAPVSRLTGERDRGKRDV